MSTAVLGTPWPGALAPVADLADDVDVLADAGQGHAQPLLGETVGDAVGLGGVEEVDAGIVGGADLAQDVASSISPHWLPRFQVPRPMAVTCQPVLPKVLVNIRFSMVVGLDDEATAKSFFPRDFHRWKHGLGTDGNLEIKMIVALCGP